MRFDQHKPAVRFSTQHVRGVALIFFMVASLTDCARKDAPPVAESAAVAAVPAAPNVSGTKINPPLGVVTEYGFKQLRAGMSYAAANDSLKGALKAAKGANLAECDYVQWEGGPAGLRVMVLENKIARIDVTDSSTMTTDAGAKIGDTEEHIKQLYGNRVSVTPHKYEEGNYLRVKSADASDTLHFIVFETAKGKVTRYRAGVMPGVDYIEGCS